MANEIVQDDRHVPDAYQGKLEANYYCRAWNGKRKKYCKAKAGAGTDHAGVGRCRWHRGNGTVTHGLYRRYEPIHVESLRQLIERFEADPDPLNMLPELAALRALFVDWINRYQDWRDALLAWYAMMGRRRDQDQVVATIVNQVLNDAAPRQVLDISDGYRLLSEASKVIERIEKIAAENAISRKDLNRVMAEQLRVLREEVKDDEAVKRVIDGWYRIRV